MKVKDTNTIIESMGSYLPKKVVSAQEILDGCTNDVNFPLARITGIEEVRVAGVDKFAIDLSIEAIKKCFEHSQYQPEDIDVVICCNISHYDEHWRYAFEPSTAVKLSQNFNFTNAQVFDISNACAGVFTGIYLADAYLKAGTAQRVLVVSGEYITHLTNTAQKEIQNFQDERMACLTLGDSGVALILEKTSDTAVGFHDIQMLTLGDYSDYCIAKTTDSGHGGAIMLTQSAKLSEVAVREGAKLVCDLVHQNKGKEVDTLLTHQTTKLSIYAGIKAVNKILDQPKFNTDNTVNNLAKRGNTSSTSHIVALIDLIEAQQINSGQKMLFSVNASGLTVGGALYTFDDLPDRMRKHSQNGNGTADQALSRHKNGQTPAQNNRIMIDSIGVIPMGENVKKSTFDMSYYAANDCFAQSELKPENVDLLLFTGVYRDEFICEPAIAAMLAGGIKMRSTNYHTNYHSFALDVLNGGLGFLNGIAVAANVIHADKAENVMILTAEIENNKSTWSDELLGIEETASGMLLKKSADEKVGFSDFIFDKYPQYVDAINVSNTWIKGVPKLEAKIDDAIETTFVDCILKTIKKSKKIQDLLDKKQISKIVAQQISSNFLHQLSDKMDCPIDMFVDVTEGRKDLFTSSIPYALHHLMNTKNDRTGEIALIISVGSGLQVGCALYQF